jgi:catechol 2,3-dioxygenase-like lactoylglutathione lyase family enzyme
MTHKFRFEGLTLTVDSVEKSIAFYNGKLGLAVEWNAAPAFATLKAPGAGGGTIGLQSSDEARKQGAEDSTPEQRHGIHVELSTDDLDALYEALKGHGIVFDQPPHDGPWERSMTAYDPDGYALEFAQAPRGKKR